MGTGVLRSRGGTSRPQVPLRGHTISATPASSTGGSPTWVFRGVLGAPGERSGPELSPWSRGESPPFVFSGHVRITNRKSGFFCR